MLANHTRHSLPFVCLLLLSLLLPQAVAESKVQVKVLDEPLAIEMPADLDQIVFIEAKYVAVVKGIGVFGNRAHIRLVMTHAQDDLGTFLDKEYGRTVLHYVNGQPYNIGSTRRMVPGRGAFLGMYGPMPGPAPLPGVPQLGPGRPPSGMWQPPAPTTPSSRLPTPTRRTRRAKSKRPASWDPAFGPFQVQAQETQPSGPVVHEFRILAETPERAEQLARALISAYNNYAESSRRRVQDSLKEYQMRVPELDLALEKAQQQDNELSQQLDGLEPIPQQVYEELKTKEWTLRVEMAGVEGRLKAAKKLTSIPISGENQTAIAQVAERISITSQIELAGLLEQLNKIDEFLQTYRHYTQLTAKMKSASAALSRANNSKAKTERAIQTMKKTLEEQLVPFELTEPVQIRPIEWTKASAPEPGFSPRSGRTRR